VPLLQSVVETESLAPLALTSAAPAVADPLEAADVPFTQGMLASLALLLTRALVIVESHSAVAVLTHTLDQLVAGARPSL